MKFDESGKRVKRKIHPPKKSDSDNIHVDLKSEYDGISDSAINMVLNMTRKDKIEEMKMVLRKIQPYTSKINTFI